MRIDGKVAIVTGAASGIGAQCAETLARAGAKVIATDIDSAGGERVARKIAEARGDAIFLDQDVTQEARWPQVIAAAEGRFGRLDIMVANAGIGLVVPLEEMSLVDWRRQQAINLDGVFLAVKHAIPAMRRVGGGSIILMSSVAGLRGAVGLAGYCASKGGVRLLAKAVALEVASANIRVNSVHPGIIATPIWGKLTPSAGAERRNAPLEPPLDPHERARGAVPLGLAGEAQDIADGVLFLASDAARYVTGSELVIDGGMMAGAAPRPRT
jgi:NAD(P)-dependent dehydrogenase (short-subunit alcohol dehydrogenase family)